jgi:hypothetical protein
MIVLRIPPKIQIIPICNNSKNRIMPRLLLLLLLHLLMFLVGNLLSVSSGELWDNDGGGCYTEIIAPKPNETIVQLMQLPIMHQDPVYVEIELVINTTCFTPIIIEIECVSEKCANNFEFLRFQEVEVQRREDKTWREVVIAYNISGGSYQLYVGNASHTFTVEKKFRFRQVPSMNRYVNQTPVFTGTFGRGSYWDLIYHTIVFDYLPWTIEIGSFSSFFEGAILLLSYKGGLHRTDFVTHVSTITLHSYFM